MLANLLLSWILSALLLLLMAQFVPGFRISGMGSALLAVLMIGLINGTLGLVMRIAAFPITLVTFGLFLLVINALVLKVAAALMPGFSIRGFLPAVVAAVLLSLLHILLQFSLYGHPIRPLSV